MKNQLGVYLQQEWVSKHSAPTLGITGRAPADWRVRVHDILKTPADIENNNTLEITTGRMNQWSSLLVSKLAPTFEVGNNLVPIDFVSFSADTMSKMAEMAYNPDVPVHFLFKAMSDNPVKITGNSDCLGGTDGFCISAEIRVGLDNPGKDHCLMNAYLSFHHMDNSKRTFFEVRNHDISVIKDTCTKGMNVNDLESFLKTTLHLGAQFMTQFIETLNDNKLYPMTNVVCEKYVFTTNADKFGFDCVNKA